LEKKFKIFGKFFSKSNFDLKKTPKPKFSQKMDPEKPNNPGLANPVANTEHYDDNVRLTPSS